VTVLRDQYIIGWKDGAYGEWSALSTDPDYMDGFKSGEAARSIMVETRKLWKRIEKPVVRQMVLTENDAGGLDVVPAVGCPRDYAMKIREKFESSSEITFYIPR
jgi:hypothetical protein